LLFGGGFALADAFTTTGLSDYLGGTLAFIQGMHPLLVLLIVNFATVFISEVTSNTAQVQMMLPILAALSIQVGINPLMLMMSSTIAASLAFMMPVGTPPNTIVFAVKRLKISDMAKTGFLVNMVSIAAITLVMYYLGFILFDFGTLPAWAVSK